MKGKFEKGTVVVFEPDNFNKKYWEALSESDRLKYYGALGYGQKKPKFFIYLSPILNAPGHCVLVSLDNQKIETMRHESDFREVKEDEF